MTAPLFPYLQGNHKRTQIMRKDAANILKRFLLCERALIINQAAWLPAIAPIEVKLALPHMMWQDSLATQALRQRVLELQYPNQTIEAQEDTPLIEVFEETLHAPSPEAFVLSMARVFKPALLQAYQQYVSATDYLADAPTVRLLKQAMVEKREQVQQLTRHAGRMLVTNPTRRTEAETWVTELNRRLITVGGLSLNEPISSTGWLRHSKRHTFTLSQTPARDEQFCLCRYHWPGQISPDFNGTDSLHQQLRSAINQFNQMWAVEIGGTVLYLFANQLGWEFIFNLSRITFDKSRHCWIGYERLNDWGFKPAEIPLSNYINHALKEKDPIYKLGMLCHSKSQHSKNTALTNNRRSRHNIEFIEADEAPNFDFCHHWLQILHTAQPDATPKPATVKSYCDTLIKNALESATETDRQTINQIISGLVTKAKISVGQPV